MEIRPLLALLHLPEDAEQSFIYRVLDENVGPMDGSLFTFRRHGEEIKAHALWETVDPVTIGRGSVGTVAIYPHTPELWTHLKAGQTLGIWPTSLSVQITSSLSQEPPL